MASLGQLQLWQKRAQDRVKKYEKLVVDSKKREKDLAAKIKVKAVEDKKVVADKKAKSVGKKTAAPKKAASKKAPVAKKVAPSRSRKASASV